MDYLSETDFEVMLARLEITQSARFGEPTEISLLESWRIYGSNIFEDLTLEEKQILLVNITEAMKSEKSGK